MQAVAPIVNSRDFRALLASRVVSELGTWFAYVALTVTVYDRTGSATWVSVLLLLDILPSIALGLLVAPLLDRWVRKHVLVGAEIAGAAVFVGLAFADSIAVLLLLASLAGVSGAIFRPGLRAAMPTLVEERDLARANALVRSAGAAAVLAGPPLAGVLVAAAGAGPVFLVNAASFVVSAAVIARIPRARLQSTRSVARKPSFDGFELFRPPALRSVLVGGCVAQLAWTLMNVTEIFLARRVFHTGAAGFGLLAAATGAGLLAGSLAAGTLADRGTLHALYRNALLLGGAGLLVAATAHWFALALAAAAVATAGNALAFGFADLSVQRVAPADRLGQAFGVLQSSLSAAAVVGMLAAGPVADAVGARAAWSLAAAILVVAASAATLLGRESLAASAPLGSH
jgi:predicted MFS family arabinose efflux permease